ncbi:M23 family metallopeptidase [uncultured Algibacter sp.]|uniref:M23 family metallopeptidase n=1 Tax=uncultured Algibacter sp. TaxID=298659 RepID=UPI002630B535|nr:M23 family metallopeptidase [uncultured Algibacter sp.]
MKSIIFSLLFLCVCSSMFAQEQDSLTDKKAFKIDLSQKILVTNDRFEDSIIQQKIADSLHDLAIFEKWNTFKFNPYKDELKTYPFLVQFTDSTYASPINRKKVITSRFGWRKGRPHQGIDIDLITGDDVMAMLGGVIRFAGYSSGHGKTVVIRHYNGLETAYAHLSKYAVKVNDTVKKGQIIGLGGTTGNARGSHLHLVVSYKGNFINPEYLFDFGKDNKIRKQSQWITKHWVGAHFHNSRVKSHITFYNSYEDALASQSKQNNKQIHIVKQGDTLYSISRKYHVSLVELCKTNAIAENGILKIGKKLLIY